MNVKYAPEVLLPGSSAGGSKRGLGGLGGAPEKLVLNVQVDSLVLHCR